MRPSSLLTLAGLALAACATGDTPKLHGSDVDPEGGLPIDASTDARVDQGAPAIDAATDAGADHSAPGTDASADAGPADAAPDAPVGCSNSTTVLLAGSGSTVYTAAWKAKGAPVVSSAPGSVIDRVALSAAGTGFVAAFRSNGNALSFATYTSSWSAPVAVPSAKPVVDAPTLAKVGAAAHLAYHDGSYKFEHRAYANGAWDPSDDPVGGNGSSQAFGPSAPTVAAAGADLVLAHAGDDGLLYDWTWTSGAWKPAHQQPGASLEKGVAPSLVALSGGKSELLAVYLRKGDFKLMSVARTSGVWDAVPTLVDVNAFANDPVALAPLPGGKALAVYRGSNAQPYYSVYDATKSPVWTTPAALLTQNPTITSTPSAAIGVCGDAAVVAYTRSGGGVEIAHFDGTTFTGPDVVAATTGATYVGIATSP